MSSSTRSTRPRSAGCQSATTSSMPACIAARGLGRPVVGRREPRFRAARRRSASCTGRPGRRGCRAQGRRPPPRPDGAARTRRARACRRRRRARSRSRRAGRREGAASVSGVSGERAKRPSPPTPAPMISTSGSSWRRTAEPTPSAPTSTSPSAVLPSASSRRTPSARSSNPTAWRSPCTASSRRPSRICRSVRRSIAVCGRSPSFGGPMCGIDVSSLQLAVDHDGPRPRRRRSRRLEVELEQVVREAGAQRLTAVGVHVEAVAGAVPHRRVALVDGAADTRRGAAPGRGRARRRHRRR